MEEPEQRYFPKHHRESYYTRQHGKTRLSTYTAQNLYFNTFENLSKKNARSIRAPNKPIELQQNFGSFQRFVRLIFLASYFAACDDVGVGARRVGEFLRGM